MGRPSLKFLPPSAGGRRSVARVSAFVAFALLQPSLFNCYSEGVKELSVSIEAWSAACARTTRRKVHRAASRRSRSAARTPPYALRLWARAFGACFGRWRAPKALDNFLRKRPEDDA